MEKQGFPLESFHRDAVMQKFVNWANTQHFSLTEQCHHLRWYWLSPRMFFGFLFLSFSWVATRPSGMSLGGHQPRPALHVCDWLQKCAVLKISYLQKIKAIKFNMVKSLLTPNSVVGDGGPILMGKKKKRQNFLGIVWGHWEVLKILLTAFRVTRIWLCAICCSCAFFFAQCLYDQADKSSLLLVKVPRDAALLQIQFRVSVEESFLEKTVINVSFTASKIVFWVLFWRFFFPILLQCSHSVVLSSRFRAPFSVPFCCLLWADLICSIQHWDIQFFVLQAIFSLTQDFLTVKVLFELSKWIFFPRWQGSFAVQWKTLICWLFFFLGLY